MADEETDPRAGSVLEDRYRIEKELSSGAMGAVYRAERIGLGRVVAIKFLHPHFAQQPDFIKRFEHEALTMSKLNHPNCVSVIDFGVADSPFIVMDYVTGHTVADVIDEGPVAPPRASDMVRQILAGLAHAHDQGIIHRDIKPANVMLSSAMGAGEHVHILDFGLAKLRDTDMSMSGIVVGTPSYMSPEQASYKKLDGRSDLYSTGVLLFELLTGQKPFRSDEAFEIIRHHLESPPPRLRDVHPAGGFSEELEAVVAKALSKSPEARYPSALAFADALAGAIGEGAARAGAAPPAAVAPGRGAPAPQGAREALAPTELGSEGALTAAALPKEGATAVTPASSRPPARARGGRVAFLLVALAAVAWGAAGAPGLPGAWVEAGVGALSRARGMIEGGEGERAGGGKAEPTIETVEDARAIAAAGEVGAALRGLHELRRKQPQNAEILVLMGELYARRGWVDEALTAYGEAAALDSQYRGHAAIARQAISALGDEATRESARVLLIKHLGAPALPHLRDAVAAADSPNTASAIREVIEQIQRRAAAQGG